MRKRGQDAQLDTFSLLDPLSGLAKEAGTPGEERMLRVRLVSLDLARSNSETDGPLGRNVVLRLSLRFANKLIGRYSLEASARGDAGGSDVFSSIGSLKIVAKHKGRRSR